MGTQGHLPFGEPWYSTGTVDKWKFTSYERDTDTSLDYALMRFNSARLARFATPDPYSGSAYAGNPQSWNRYSYVVNDPVNSVDPLGLQTCTAKNCADPHQNDDLAWNLLGKPCGTVFGVPVPCQFFYAILQTGATQLSWAGDSWMTFQSAPQTVASYDYKYVPVELVAVNILDENGNILGTSYAITGGGWQLTGVTFTQTGPTTWTFTSQYPFAQTVQIFRNAGIVESPNDQKYNPLHPGNPLHLRNLAPFCSLHATVDSNSGQSPGQSTTGSIHIDSVNPFPLPTQLGPLVPLLLHGIFDVYPYGLTKLGLPIQGGASLCVGH